jgi:hypothetical protein
VRKVVIAMVAPMATSSAFARKTSHHHFKRAAIDHQSAAKPNPGGVERHPDDVALDSKDRKHLLRVLGDRSKMRPYVWVHLDDERRSRSRRVQLSGKPANEGTAVGSRLGFGNFHAAGAARSSSGNLLA